MGVRPECLGHSPVRPGEGASQEDAPFKEEVGPTEVVARGASDRTLGLGCLHLGDTSLPKEARVEAEVVAEDARGVGLLGACLLYTSDAADE